MLDRLQQKRAKLVAQRDQLTGAICILDELIAEGQQKQLRQDAEQNAFIAAKLRDDDRPARRPRPVPAADASPTMSPPSPPEMFERDPPLSVTSQDRT
jgi:hypothetical protein